MPFNSSDSLNSTNLNNTLRGLYRDNSDHAVTGTTNETTLGSTTITANTIGATGLIHLIVAGTITGSAGNKQLRAYFGGTLISDSTSAAGTVGWNLDLWIHNTATNAQRISLIRGEHSATTSFFHEYRTAAIDTTADQILKVTGTLTNSADTITETIFNVFVCQIT